jgi:hypothetical protein
MTLKLDRVNREIFRITAAMEAAKLPKSTTIDKQLLAELRMSTKRKMLSPDQQAQIRKRIAEASKLIRKYPYPVVPPVGEIDSVTTELHDIMRLNIDQHFGPIKLFDRCNKWLTRAQVIQSRRNWTEQQ